MKADLRVGMLVTLEPAADCYAWVRCRCDCGTETTVPAINLRNGKTQSCGCLKNSPHVREAVSKATKTHGMSQHPLYPTWRNMVDRTTNPNTHNYLWYGARGIKVHGPWRTDPRAFIEWVLENLGPRPPRKTPGGRPFYTLDRVNVDGDYEPGNLRWATPSQQTSNRRTLTAQARQILQLQAQLQVTQEALAKSSRRPKRRRAITEPSCMPLF